jgi:hypothetical protein
MKRGGNPVWVTPFILESFNPKKGVNLFGSYRKKAVEMRLPKAKVIDPTQENNGGHSEISNLANGLEGAERVLMTNLATLL